MRQLWAAKPLNQKAIENKTKEVTALRIQISEKSQIMFDKIKAFLTPDQQKLLETNFNQGSGCGMRSGRQGCRMN
ncbi:MAG TPA: hypothetical protein VEC37_06505 [Bacillota bacterium]|nr:hypothetical protein [Bacillota bacterium]